MAKTFYIIDAMNSIYRCYHAPMMNLRAPGGEPTKATYLFTKDLIKLCNTHKPDFIAVAADGDKSMLYRRQLDPTYKMNRGQEKPEDVVVQIARSLQICELLGLPVFVAEGYEADDIIATFIDAVEGLDIDCVIVGRDKDLMQCVGPRVRMFDARANEWIDEEAVRAKWGVAPSRVVEVQTLAGDPTDNVPGVRGIGNVTAIKLIKEYGTAAGVLANRAKLKPGIAKHLNEQVLTHTRSLVRLYRNVPLPMEGRDLRFKGLQFSKARKMFDLLGFNNLPRA